LLQAAAVLLAQIRNSCNQETIVYFDWARRRPGGWTGGVSPPRGAGTAPGQPAGRRRAYLVPASAATGRAKSTPRVRIRSTCSTACIPSVATAPTGRAAVPAAGWAASRRPAAPG